MIAHLTAWGNAGLESLGLAVALLAQQSPFRSMGSNFRGRSARFDSGDLVVLLVIAAAIGFGVWLLARLLHRQENGKKPFNNPRALFHELCKAHELDSSARRLLARLARHHRLPLAAQLFLQPRCFETAALPQAFQGEAGQIDALRARLFSFPAAQSES